MDSPPDEPRREPSLTSQGALNVPPPTAPEPPPVRERRRTPRWVRLVQWLFALALLGALAAGVGVVMVLQYYSHDLPSTEALANYDPPVVTRLYSADGRILAEYAKEKRVFLPLTAIPKNVQEAFISAEDQDFYSNKGVDFWGIVRAAKNNLVHVGSGHSMAGGSTITQQVVKNFLLTPEKSIARKVKEAILAYRISKIYSKDKILELYLNEIYLGRSTYGVAAAAVTYFDKSLDQLSTEEAATLAAMPKAPSSFDPAKNYARALDRRNYVIQRMYNDGYITQVEEQRAMRTPIVTRTRAKSEVADADFFAEEVRRTLSTMYGPAVLYGGGLFVKTTLNPDYQDYADRALRFALTQYDRRHGWRGAIANLNGDAGSRTQALAKIRQDKGIPLFDEQQLAVVERTEPKVEIELMNGDHGTIPPEELTWIAPHKLGAGDVVIAEPAESGKGNFRLLQIPEVNGAMVVMEPSTGKVLAMSGGYSWGGTVFNRATQAKRQPGSAFKPFVYMTALEAGLSPTSIILDGPVSLPQGPGLPMWQPKNFEGDYLGPQPLRIGLEKSRNAMTVRIAEIIGLKRIKRVAQRMGIYPEDQEFNFSAVLGAREVTLVRLADAYAMIANGGRRVEPWLIERIDDRNGLTIFRRDTRICEVCVMNGGNAAVGSIAPTLADERERVIDPRVDYQMQSLLQGVVLRGTGEAARVLGRTGVGGKTGTTNDSRDTWFMGITPDIVVATYVGFDTPKSLGAKETGGRVAIQGFIKFMQQAGQSIPDRDFPVPPGIHLVPVDRHTGQPLGQGQPFDGKADVMEAFVTGGPIYKPFNELQEELKEKEENPAIQNDQQQMGVPLDQNGSVTPGMGEMAPYQRPVDSQGFDPTEGTGSGTGGLY